jgi:hypothetical protein
MAATAAGWRLKRSRMVKMRRSKTTVRATREVRSRGHIMVPPSRKIWIMWEKGSSYLMIRDYHLRANEITDQ